jgi:dolichyl-diphosphooligosaccharide--protein glycosyltransferase
MVSGHRIIHVTSAVLICLALFSSAHMRVWQYDQWSDAQDIYYVEDFPAYSTTDAAYFLLVAQEIKTHGTSKDLSRYRSYPDSIDNVPALERSIRDEPLLGVLISYLSPNASLESLSMTAHELLPVSVTLTALAVILAFGAAGFWNEGAIAALGSSLSSAFLGRTSAGRLDTDQLNLGFFYLIIALIIGAGRVKNIWLALMLCGAAAAVTHLFHWWWPKPILYWFYLLGLVWLTYCFSRSLTRTALLGGVYLALISTLNFGPSVYVSEFTATITSFGQMKLPNTFDAIAELEVLSAGEFLNALMGNVWLGGLAILGIAGWVCVSPVFAVIFIPAICLAAMNTVFGNRVVFFAAPVFWFGLAWFALTSGRYVFCRLIQGNVTTPSTGFARVQACLAFAMLATTYFVSFNPLSKPYVPDTAFSREVVEGFRYLGDHVRQTEINASL